MRNLIEMYLKMQTNLNAEKGQTMVEYALLLALIAMGVALAIPGLTTGIIGLFATVGAAL